MSGILLKKWVKKTGKTHEYTRRYEIAGEIRTVSYRFENQSFGRTGPHWKALLHHHSGIGGRLHINGTFSSLEKAMQLAPAMLRSMIEKKCPTTLKFYCLICSRCTS
jgi:hypothetical protein